MLLCGKKNYKFGALNLPDNSSLPIVKLPETFNHRSKCWPDPLCATAVKRFWLICQ